MTLTGGNSTTFVPYLAQFFFSPECYEKVVLEFDLDGPCLQLLSSKLIGYTIVVITSLFVRGPQVVKILLEGSAEGISFLSMVFAILSGTTAVTYSVAKDFPFSVWGEGIALTLQNLTIGLLILLYSGRYLSSTIYMLVFMLLMGLLLSPLVPLSVHCMLQMLSVPMTASSKLAQIWANISNGSTGQLSTLSVFMMVFRSGGRLYTFLAETGDPYRIAVYAVATGLNMVLAAQIIYYRKVTQKIKRS